MSFTFWVYYAIPAKEFHCFHAQLLHMHLDSLLKDISDLENHENNNVETFKPCESWANHSLWKENFYDIIFYLEA